MKRELAELRRKITDCCALVGFQDELSTGTAKRQDRLEARLRQTRSDLRVRLEILRLRVDELERAQNLHDQRLRVIEALVGQGKAAS